VSRKNVENKLKVSALEAFASTSYFCCFYSKPIFRLLLYVRCLFVLVFVVVVWFGRPALNLPPRFSLLLSLLSSSALACTSFFVLSLSGLGRLVNASDAASDSNLRERADQLLRQRATGKAHKPTPTRPTPPNQTTNQQQQPNTTNISNTISNKQTSPSDSNVMMIQCDIQSLAIDSKSFAATGEALSFSR